MECRSVSPYEGLVPGEWYVQKPQYLDQLIPLNILHSVVGRQLKMIAESPQDGISTGISLRYDSSYTEKQKIVRSCATLSDILAYLNGPASMVDENDAKFQVGIWIYFIKIALKMEIDDFEGFYQYLLDRVPHLEQDFLTAFRIVNAETKTEVRSHLRQNHCIVM